MKLQLATIDDFEAVLAFYDYVVDKTPGIAAYAQWQKGKAVSPARQGAGIGAKMVLEAIRIAMTRSMNND